MMDMEIQVTKLVLHVMVMPPHVQCTRIWTRYMGMGISVIRVVEKARMKFLKNVVMDIQALICIAQPMIMTIVLLPISTVHTVKPMCMINNRVIHKIFLELKSL